MNVLKISDFCETGSGGTPSRSRQIEYYDGGTIPWVKSGELAQRVVDSAEEFITEKGLSDSSAKLLKPGAILIAMYGATVGQVSRLTIPAATNQAICHIYPDEAVCVPEYLYRVLKGAKDRLLAKRVGGGQPNISQKIVRGFRIPLPPLAEQKRIAGILDAADALRVKRRKSLAQLDTLLQSAFVDMFGDPVTNPMEWERKPLGEVTSIDAPMVDPTEEQYRELLHYGPDRIEKDTGELLPALTAEEDELISGKFLCTPGEILYSKIRPYLNKVALVKQRCLCSADVYPIVASPEFLNREYLWVLLRSQAFLDYVAGFSRRANIPKLNRKQFAGYAAPVPPLDLQHRFTAIVESVDEDKTRQRAHLAELDTLFASLQSRAFRGDL